MKGGELKLSAKRIKLKLRDLKPNPYKKEIQGGAA
jgi:hypothetical protein